MQNGISDHNIFSVTDKLYCWGGDRRDIPEVHNSEDKIRLTSEVYTENTNTLSWSTIPTYGTQPNAIRLYSCCTIDSTMYIFGGNCLLNDCFHNDLFSLDMSTKRWNEIIFDSSPSVIYPIKKHGHGMILFVDNNEEYLVVFGGYGPTPTTSTNQQQQQYRAQYILHPTLPNRVYTNEIHIVCISSSPCEYNVIV